MISPSRLVYLVIFCICLLFSTVCFALEDLNIRAEQDTAYLPLRYVEMNSHSTGDLTKGIGHRFFVIQKGQDSILQAKIISLSNSSFTSDMPAISNLEFYPSRHIIDNDVFNLTINDCRLYRDSSRECAALVGAGYRNDSAFFFNLCPDGEEKIDFLYLCKGKDTLYNNIWEPQIYFNKLMDYDFDGLTEAFVFLSSKREIGPRRLFCIELETMQIEWTLDVASQLFNDRLYSCGDSSNPQIMFITGNPMQGRSDDNYSDSYAFISIVNSRGEILFNKIISVRATRRDLIPTEEDGYFYLMHQCPLVSPDSVAVLAEADNLESLYRDTLTLSKINSRGEILKSVTLPIYASTIWLLPYQDRLLNTLFAVDDKRNVIALDTGLNVFASGGPVKMGNFQKVVSIPDYGEVLHFDDGLYTKDLQKIVHYPFFAENFDAVMLDSASNTTMLGLSDYKTFSIGYLEERNIIEMASNFYHRNQSYFLMLISGLIAGLFTIIIYRFRDKQVLKLIQKQKRELEETHQALREAQQTIIAQEKYKQAKDIAGGFAHEIRNALFPAEGTLSMLLLKKDMLLKKPELLEEFSRDAKAAVEKAIDITELISQFTRLDSQNNPEPVDIPKTIGEVIEANKLRIGQLEVSVQTEQLENLRVIANTQQIYIVFNNLILNSLDALEDFSGEKTIRITSEQRGDRVRISFADSGPGIPPEDHENVFNTFYSTKPDKGTGIGLATAKKIIEMYHGDISIAVEDGVGTNFVIHLQVDTQELRHD